MSASSEPVCTGPIRPDELDELFAPFFGTGGERSLALAVSGGSDSTALMVLAADWLAARHLDRGLHMVITVDHGLRGEAAAEARAVAAQAAAFGFRHAILAWQGPKPRSGVQEAARAARYRLMGEHMLANGIELLLTAHTRDDVAETFLMRLARGSGLDGLAAMAPRMRLSDLGFAPAGLARGDIGRPLLGVPKSRLCATLQARGVTWIEDPSNQSQVYERSRLRAARVQLDAVGLGDAMLALSARRLQRARRALEGSVAQFCNPASEAVSVDACGCIAIDRMRLRAADAEIALRVLGRAIAAAGGSGQPVPLARLEEIGDAIQQNDAARAKWTLARAMITVTDDSVLVEREPGREPLPQLVLRPGECARWDGRFDVSVQHGASQVPIDVRALGEHRLAELRRQGCTTNRVSSGLAAMAPSFWEEGMLLAVPPLGYWATPQAREGLAAEFAWVHATSGDPR